MRAHAHRTDSRTFNSLMCTRMNAENQINSFPDELHKFHMQLEVTGLKCEQVSAEIWPTVLTATLVEAVVNWEGADVWGTVVRAGGDASVQTRLVTLAYAATGPDCVEAIPIFSANNWATVRLTMPDVGHPNRSIHIDLNRAQWEARASTSPASALASTLEITTELRHHEVGTVLFEMASRLLRTSQ